MDTEAPIDHGTVRSLKQFAERAGERADRWDGPTSVIDTTLWPTGEWVVEIRENGSWAARRRRSLFALNGLDLDFGPTADAIILDEEHEYVEAAIGEDAIYRGEASTAVEFRSRSMPESPLECSNCGWSIATHCRVHTIPCCPGKCAGKHEVQAGASLSATSDEAPKSEVLTVEIEATRSKLDSGMATLRLAFEKLVARQEAACALIYLTTAKEALRRALRDGVLPAPVIEALQDLERAASLLRKGTD